jgi:branched-chain amino acid transport system ATP-binding protein
MSLLSVNDLRVEHRGRLVLDGVGFDLEPGQVLAVLGPNGAGKTTLLEAVAGLVPATGGSVRLDGQELGGRPAWERATRGLRLVGQGRQVVPELTVAQNLEVACRGAGLEGAPAEVMALFPQLGPRARLAAGQLSGGEQQMLAIAMGLVARPGVLLLDEPSFGLAPAVVDVLFATLRKLREDGYSLVLTEQHVTRALALADSVMVLRSGRKVFEREIRRRTSARLLAEVLESYMGNGEMSTGATGAIVDELVKVTLPVGLKRELQLRARSRGTSPSELVSEAVAAWLQESGPPP